MNKVKIIDAAREVYWASTYQGVFEVDGTAVEFRFHENSNGAEFYVFIEGEGWVEMYDMDDDSPEAIVYNMCLEMNPEEWGSSGEEVEFEAGEDWI